MADFIQEQSPFVQLEQILQEIFPASDTIKHYSQQTIQVGDQLRRVDYMVAHETYGLFVFQIRSYSINLISNVTEEQWSIDNYPFTNPYRQVQAQVNALLSRIHSKHVKGYGLIMLPRITQEEWLKRDFSPSAIPVNHLIFADELNSETVQKKIMRLIHHE